jgi:hypothetical protein
LLGRYGGVSGFDNGFVPAVALAAHADFDAEVREGAPVLLARIL